MVIESLYDVIVVGSGAAGTFSALGLRGTKTLVLDVGLRFGETSLEGNLYDSRKRQSMFAETVGARFESLASLAGRELSPKVKSPFMRCVVDRPAGMPEVRSSDFDALVSYAAGGLANAWGAQLYRFDNRDLQGFPLDAAELEPFYDEITQHIGVSGVADDDLARFHGSGVGLQAPLDLSPAGFEILSRYSRQREALNREGVFLGRPRLAVLSKDHNGRTSCAYDNLEFFKPRLSAVYSPAFTLEDLVRRGEIEYRSGWVVQAYRETGGAIEVDARPLGGGDLQRFRARKLILCLGALNSARLVLQVNGDTESRLPLVETPCFVAPLVSLRRIGEPIEKRSFYSQLNLFYSGPLWPEPLVGMIYTVDGLLRSDLLFNFPFSLRGCLAGARYLLPAMTLLQIFYPGAPDPSNTLGIDGTGSMVLRYGARTAGGVERHILRALRRLGQWSSARLVRAAFPGGSVHYGGPLPMKDRPEGKYETDRNGLLAGTKAVYVADAAVFPRLPAKNLTFTIMANALRIGRMVRTALVR